MTICELINQLTNVILFTNVASQIYTLNGWKVTKQWWTYFTLYTKERWTDFIYRML